jgi:hypothetical protein
MIATEKHIRRVIYVELYAADDNVVLPTIVPGGNTEVESIARPYLRELSGAGVSAF